MDGSRLLQELNLIARQPRRAPHHAIHLIKQSLLPSKCRVSQPYRDLELATLTGREFGSPAPMHQMFPTTLLPPIKFRSIKMFWWDNKPMLFKLVFKFTWTYTAIAVETLYACLISVGVVLIVFC